MVNFIYNFLVTTQVLGNTLAAWSDARKFWFDAMHLPHMRVHILYYHLKVVVMIIITIIL